jgi:putative restriction endonuclease
MAQRLTKQELLDIITQAVKEDGWNVLYLSTEHPFRIKIFRDSESHQVKIYIWNLTHGGGPARPTGEYRIQVTGLTEDRFLQLPGEKTIILGWWNEAEVFAGFDYSRHAARLGASPSIQIREEALRKAHEKAFATWRKDNEEIAIAFKREFIVEYIRNLVGLHSFGESEEALSVLEGLAERPEAVNDLEIARLSVERQTAVKNVKKKMRDASFKTRVLACYQHRCAFCGMQLKLIDAAHILPVEHHGSDDTSNGISLCALHHRAYDRNLVTFNERYEVIQDESSYQKLRQIGWDGGLDRFVRDLRSLILLPPAISDRPHINNIRLANELRGWSN